MSGTSARSQLACTNEHVINVTCGTIRQEPNCLPEACGTRPSPVQEALEKLLQNHEALRKDSDQQVFDEEFIGFNNGTYGRLLSQSFTWLQGTLITAQPPLAPPAQPALQGKVDLGSTALARFRMSLPKKAAAAFLGQNPMFTSQMDVQAAPSSALLLEAEARHALAKSCIGERSCQFAKPLPFADSCCLLQLPSSKFVGLARWVLVTCGSCCTGQEALLKFCSTCAS